MKNKLAAIGLLLLMAVFVFYFYTNNPSDEQTFFVKCSFKTLTGLECPGCGAQRCVHHLLHFDVIQALRYNAAFVLLVPYLGILIFYEFRKIFWGTPKPNNVFTSYKMLWIILVLLLVFGVLRNLPFYPFTYLKPPV